MLKKYRATNAGFRYRASESGSKLSNCKVIKVVAAAAAVADALGGGL